MPRNVRIFIVIKQAVIRCQSHFNCKRLWAHIMFFDDVKYFVYSEINIRLD